MKQIHDSLPDLVGPADDADQVADAVAEALTEQRAAIPEEYAPDDPRPFEANPADVAEQAVPVPVDDEEHERS